MEGWKTLSRKTVLDQRPYLAVENHAVELPDGRLIPDWPWVITPDYVNILAATADGHFLCFRQGKYALDGVALAPVGGYIEPGEQPLAAARRELLEETGYEAAEWVSLGGYAVCANRGVATGHLFLALGARRVGEPNGEELEAQELLLLSRQEVEDALARGEFKVMAWTTVVALALLRLGRGGC
jgi:ADP-ribose pyrophosphatase